MKREAARKHIAGAAAAAGGAALQPFPVADAIVLAPIQLKMMSKITVLYEVDNIGLMDASKLAPIMLAFGGKAAARSLLKLIPGAGHIINASVAATLTGASGESWRRFCEAVFKGDVDVSSADDFWKTYGSSAVEVLGLFARGKSRRVSEGS